MQKPIPFGKYYLLDRINVGGMAEVFRAKAFGVEGFERLVAVKRILPSIAEDTQFIAMFIDEAKIAVQLTHASIAQIFDLGKVGDAYFIALEYIHGRDLRAIFQSARKRGEALPPWLACYLMMKVCEGLDYAHNKRDSHGHPLDLVHRDVSPQNILVSFDGEVKIIDFGIAKAAGRAGKTQAGILKGKFGYLSPEQVAGQRVDRRSDVFAAGTCLYELLTGERLFAGDSDFSSLEKVRSAELPPLSGLGAHLPEALRAIVSRALQRDVNLRYQTAIDLHDDLQSFLHSSGHNFARKDLSAWMRVRFGRDIQRSSRGQMGPLDPIGPAEVEPQTVSDKKDDERTAAHMSQAGSSGAKPKSTILGMPPVAPRNRPAARTVPPPPRSSRSMPPPPGGGRGSITPPQGAGRSVPPPPRSSVPVLASAQRDEPGEDRGRPGSAVDMDWDDEELSTQIYDRPDDEDFETLGGPGQLHGVPTYVPPVSGGRSMPGSSTPSASGPLPRFGPGGEPATGQARVGTQRPSVSRFASPWTVLAGLVGLGVLVWGASEFFGGSGDPGVLQLTTVPKDAQAVFDSEAVMGSASPFLIANITPGSPHLLEVSAPGHVSWSQPVQVNPGQQLQFTVELELATGQAKQPESVTSTIPAPSSTGEKFDPKLTGFSVESSPRGASVYLNGNKLGGVTPMRVTGLAPGPYKLRLELLGFKALPASSLKIEADTVKALPKFVLTGTPVNVTFESVPSGAMVRLVRGADSRTLGTTPLTSAVEPGEEPWAVEISQEGYDLHRGVLKFNPGEPEARYTATLEKVARPAKPARRPAAKPRPAPSAAGGPGTLRVNSRPWSQVYVDGKLIGNTPQMNISLPAGRHQLKLVNPDFNLKKSMPVVIRAGETSTKIVNLN